MFRRASRSFSSNIVQGLGVRNSSTKSIGTHNGLFHCDEALAVYLLRQTKEFKEAKLIRTRDPSLLSKCDVVVDVGGEFDTARLRFDHHQVSFSERFDQYNDIRLSAAGLVYKYFGEEVIGNLLEHKSDEFDASTLQLIHKKLYNKFIKAVDGVDNGIPSSSGETLYTDYTTISFRVRRLNPRWNEEKNMAIENERFERASALVGDEFNQSLHEIVYSWLPAKKLVEEGFENRYTHHNSGKVVVFEQICPWYEHLSSLNANSILYTVYPINENDWRVQCVKKQGSTFESKRPLPKSWRGLSQDDLRKITSLKSAIFVHASGFIGGCGNYEDAIKMADMALKYEQTF
ncbi:urease accessory protein [Sporodiniella umbellata]|nr:urease accessory protein [Sporodiniella umbellata]